MESRRRPKPRAAAAKPWVAEAERGLAELCVPLEASLLQVMEKIDRSGSAIALVVDGDGRLLATVTDGDVRRALLRGESLDAEVGSVRLAAGRPRGAAPLTAAPGTPASQLLHLMVVNDVRHIPIVNEEGRVIDLVLLTDLVAEVEAPLSAVVMAGGEGTRLLPLTAALPKPMLPVGDRPMLQRIIEQLRGAGIRRISIATHYRPEQIVDYFQDGRTIGVDISYLHEEEPLGTAGALGPLAAVNDLLLVINGDILTELNFRRLLEFHNDAAADMTVAVRRFEVHIPYGVVETEGIQVRSLTEKPTIPYFINAGVYLINREVLRLIPAGQRFDMTDLINRALVERKVVASFPIHEYWLDIGQHRDYRQALTDLDGGILA